MSLGRNTSVYQAHDTAFLSDLHALSLHGLKAQRKKVLGHLVNHLSGKERMQLNTEPIGPNEKVTGFLLRSGVVSGWPGLQVAAFSDVDQINPCTLLRMDHLSPNVLFCMYEGEVRSVRINEHTEALHFGVDISPNPPHTYSKSFRYIVDVDGHKAGKQVDDKVAPPLQMAAYERGSNSRVIRMNDLAKAMQQELDDDIGYKGPFTSAEFALEMVEGVEAVNFNFKPEEKR